MSASALLALPHRRVADHSTTPGLRYFGMPQLNQRLARSRRTFSQPERRNFLGCNRQDVFAEKNQIPPISRE